jgi:hypothetical protein
MLWVIVTTLWTVASVLRIQRTWVPGTAWPVILGDVYTWVSLFLPPLLFAIILLAVKRIAAAGGRSAGAGLAIRREHLDEAGAARRDRASAQTIGTPFEPDR